MIQNFKWTLISSLLIFGIALSSCNKNDDDGSSQNQTPSGIFITNEGPFQNGSGSVSFWDRSTETVEHLYYERANNGAQVGNILQSMFVSGERAYLVVNNANKVIVVDFSNFEMIAEISGLALPRYFVTANNSKAYVSQWGSTGTDGSIQVINLDNFTIEKEIPTGSGAEQMILENDRLYVVNSGGWGRDSTLVVIDTNTDEIVNTIVIGDNPNSMVKDVNNDIWTISLGHTENWNDPNDPLNTKGKLVRLENEQIVQSFEVPGGRNLVINEDGTKMYFTLNDFAGTVYDHWISQDNLSTDPFITGSFYRLGFDPVSRNLLAADAKDFATTGLIQMRDINGDLVRSFEAGIIPGGFWVAE